jgi:thiol-disulfide isomerase/thioredoxin
MPEDPDLGFGLFHHSLPAEHAPLLFLPIPSSPFRSIRKRILRMAATPRAAKRPREDESHSPEAAAAALSPKLSNLSVHGQHAGSKKPHHSPSQGQQQHHSKTNCIGSEEELRSVLAGDHPLLSHLMRGEEEVSVFVLVHSPWDRVEYSLQTLATELQQQFSQGAGQGQSQPTAGHALFTVDASVVEAAGDLLHLVSGPLPVLVTLHFSHMVCDEFSTQTLEHFQRTHHSNPGSHTSHHGVPTRHVRKVAEKPLHKHIPSYFEMRKALVSAMALPPVHSLGHLRRLISRAPSGTFTVVWYSASWCPPCNRVLENLHYIRSHLPKGIVQLVKADKDHTQKLYDHFQVKLIPTFQVFHNGADKAIGNAMIPIGTLQNSNTELILQFLDRSCAPLKFGLSQEDDF